MAQAVLPRWKSDLSFLFVDIEVDLEKSLVRSHDDSQLFSTLNQPTLRHSAQDISFYFPKISASPFRDGIPGPVSQASTMIVPSGNRTSTISFSESRHATNSSSLGINTELDPVKRACIVCMEERPLGQFPSGTITESCAHQSLTCFVCLQYSIACQHQNNMWNNITCPQCYQRLSYHDMRKFADPDTFKRYDSLCTREALSSLTNFVWCLGCDAGQIHDDGECPAVTCQNCGIISCSKHQVFWHEGFTCDQYDRLINGNSFSTIKNWFSANTQSSMRFPRTGGITPRSGTLDQFVAGVIYLASPSQAGHASSGSGSTSAESDKNPIARIRIQVQNQQASIRRIKRVCKRCPGPGCNWPIQKIDGCKHMTCLNCTFEFCWRCRSYWTYGHKCWKWWSRNR